MRQCWNRCADGSTAWASLEEARTKLILGAIPERIAVAGEVKERLALWEGGDFVDLLRKFFVLCRDHLALHGDVSFFVQQHLLFIV